MNPRVRKFFLTLHVTFSVGWFGAVVGFSALNIAVLIGQTSQVIRSGFIAMDLIACYVILPFCLGSLLTGVIQALGTSWGLFKHYWILVKFFLTAGSTFLLLLHMQLIEQGATLASVTLFLKAELQSVGLQLIYRVIPSLLVLLTAITISVYKPWGMVITNSSITDKDATIEKSEKKSIGFYAVFGLIILAVIFIVRHWLAGGMSHY